MDEKERIIQLRKELHEHNYRYYVLNQPTIGDQEFDFMMHELQDLEARHPEVADANSPTQRVGSDLNEEFRHEYLGQLNAYVSYYKENEMHDGDNPPVGILLCTRKGKKMVEYAIAGMDNNLFVSTYMLQLPDKATLEKFLHDEIEKQDL